MEERRSHQRLRKVDRMPCPSIDCLAKSNKTARSRPVLLPSRYRNFHEGPVIKPKSAISNQTVWCRLRRLRPAYPPFLPSVAPKPCGRTLKRLNVSTTESSPPVAKPPVAKQWEPSRAHLDNKTSPTPRYPSSLPPFPDTPAVRMLKKLLSRASNCPHDSPALRMWESIQCSARNAPANQVAAKSGRSKAGQLLHKGLNERSQYWLGQEKATVVIPRPARSFFKHHPLIADSVNRSTELLYSKALDRFTETVAPYFNNVEHLDEILLQYIEANHEDSPTPGPKQEMSNLMCGLFKVLPKTKTSLGLSHCALKGASYNIQNDRKEQTQSAAILTFAWGGYLRASEAIGLNSDDVAYPGDYRLSAYVRSVTCVAIRNAKTGPLQFTPIYDENIVSVVRRLQTMLQSKVGKMFSITYATYAKHLREACNFFGLDDLKMSTHLARVGGALHSFMSGKPIADITIVGRWNSRSSLRHYLTTGRSWLLRIKLSADQESLLQEYNRSLKYYTLPNANAAQERRSSIAGFWGSSSHKHGEL
ncbi:DNA breaking-rejoining enzyme [Gracilaria domingensis]|nr:DNA breaking-rejoining enzyme [Gracilaria domingensis]